MSLKVPLKYNILVAKKVKVNMYKSFDLNIQRRNLSYNVAIRFEVLFILVHVYLVYCKVCDH